MVLLKHFQMPRAATVMKHSRKRKLARSPAPPQNILIGIFSLFVFFLIFCFILILKQRDGCLFSAAHVYDLCVSVTKMLITGFQSFIIL